MVIRNSRAPFLFKFCRVVYDKDKKRLDIKDGDFVGKSLRSLAPKQPDYDKAVLNLEIVESLSHGEWFVKAQISLLSLVGGF